MVEILLEMDGAVVFEVFRAADVEAIFVQANP